MNILLLVSAALSYSIEGYFMKLSDGLSRPGPTSLVLGLFCFGAILQTIAMRHGELSVTYILVLGLEAITALALGLLFLGEGVTALKLAGISLVVLGVVVLRV